MFTYGHIEAVNREQHQDRLRRAEKNQLVEQIQTNRKQSGGRQIIRKIRATPEKQACCEGRVNATDLANQSA